MKVGVLDLSLKQNQKAIEDRLSQISYDLAVNNPKEKIANKITEMRESLYSLPTQEEGNISGNLQEEDNIYGNLVDTTT
ncbi:MAG: hypothetical protein QMD92_06075 [bacterium]|nr:hypothetical protein [bacterium]